MSDEPPPTRSRLDRGEAVEVALPPRPGTRRFSGNTVISLGLLALLWQAIAYVSPPYVAPGWGTILERLLALRFDFVLITVARVFVALAISFCLGLAGAAISYASPRAEGLLLPIVRLIMAVPVVCWIIFAVLWFRGLEFRIDFVLVVVCAPIFWVDFLDGMKSISKDLRDMLWSLRPSRWHFFSKLILPATTPTILTSCKINLSLAIRVVTMAELVGATSGIGYGLVIAQSLLSVADVFAWTLVLVAILYASQMALGLLESRLLRWRE